ncbi:MAG: cupin domain-containing protein [Caulobacteraceae bacterium]
MRILPIAAAVIAAVIALPAQSQPAQSQPAQAAPPRAASPPMFSAALPDAPGKQLVVVKLSFPAGNAPKGPPHRHPGSVWVYVTQGEARLGIEGQPPKIVRAGEGFFEPEGAVHNVSESTSPTEPAAGIAVMLVPNGAPLVTVVEAHAGH